MKSTLQKWFLAVQSRSYVGSALVFVALSAIAAIAEQRWAPPATHAEADDVELYQALLDLQNPWTVMCVAAHPDDEDGATLTLLRRRHGVHTVTLFSTYGEGGQNATGPELYEELGAIRARETLGASLIQGSEPHFLGLRDFGFSKSADETFRIWGFDANSSNGHEVALRLMVLKIRQLRPDVIITNHNPTSGHGHHQATGQLVLEAFDAAADPRRFPEQLRGKVVVWQAQRLFVRVGGPGGTGNRASQDEAGLAGELVSIDRHQRDPVRGTTYAEQALRALQQHASQGPWPKTVPAGWAAPIRYRLARSAKDAPALPPGAQSFLDGLQLPRKLANRLTPLAIRALLPLSRAEGDRQILNGLLELRKLGVLAVPARTVDRPRFRLMTERLNRALVTASGIKAALTPRNPVLIPGTATSVALEISNDGDRDVRIVGLKLRGLRRARRMTYQQSLAPGQSITLDLLSSPPRTSGISVPHAEHLYDGKLMGQELAATINVEISGASFPVEARRRIDVVPAVEIASVTPSPLVLTPGTQKQPPSSGPTLHYRPGSFFPRNSFKLDLINHQDKTFNGEVLVGGRSSQIASRGQEVTLAPKETRQLVVDRSGSFSVVEAAGGRRHPLPNILTFTVVDAGISTALTQRKVRVVYSEARVAPDLQVGYVRSFDDTLRDSLDALGVQAKELKVDDVRTGDLKTYQTIIVDNRGYQAHPELIEANARLLDYVRAGGTLIVFYHRTNEWNPDSRAGRPQLAPYPIVVGNLRVTDERASVQFLESQHPLLNHPNRITHEDFAGWIQERGLYYPESWDRRYTALLSMSDSNEPPLRGGLLAADYGQGRYIYTSMVWYRQLRAGVPGAYRILANMISYGRSP